MWYNSSLCFSVIAMLVMMRMPASADELSVENGRVRVTVTKESAGYRESYYARSNGAWHLVLQSGSSLRPEPAMMADRRLVSGLVLTARVVRSDASTRQIVLSGGDAPDAFVKTITLYNESPYVGVMVRYALKERRTIEYLLSTYSFKPEGRPYLDWKPLDFVFTPQLRPLPDEVIADHTFRSPALIMQKANIIAALVPDVETIDGRERPLKACADMQVETADAPFFSFGLMNWVRRKEHVFYSHIDTMAVALSGGSLAYGFHLYIAADAAPRRGFEEVVRYHWRENGHRNLLVTPGPQSEPFSRYVHKAWYEYLPQVALDAMYNGKPVTLLRQGRLAWSNKLPLSADNDCWFNVWFNALRTAYGMYLCGRDSGDEHLMHQAERVLNLALSAPQDHGIVPSIFYLDSTGGHWVADQAWGGIGRGEYLPMFHNAWTGYWLLAWIDLVPSRRAEILHFTGAFARFLLEHQEASGVIPSWYQPETLEPADPLRDENSETAGAALFLAEYFAHTKDPESLNGAKRAMEFIFTRMLPENKWYDYETFFSCSRKPLGFFDAYTFQHPQNTLSMQMAAEACAALYAATGEARYKETGSSILDYLCLYQQVWSPQWLSRKLFGGFGVQNTDGEWSDSRQGYFAVTLMKYYELTGRREYLERSVAALRAMFSLFVSPESPITAENYAHGAEDKLAGVTGIHWGTGSSVVSIRIITERYGGAFVNVAHAWGVGIDGCSIPDVAVSRDTVSLRLTDTIATPRKVRVCFGECTAPTYTVMVNGTVVGTYPREDLRKGVDIQID